MEQEKTPTVEPKEKITQTPTLNAGTPSTPPSIQVNVQNVVQQSSPNNAPVVIVNNEDDGPSILLQLVWFLLIGWWLSQLAIILGYTLILSVIFMPFGVWILNRMPEIVALRKPKREMTVTQEGGVISVKRKNREQRNIFLRIAYFLLIGWWFAAIVLELAWLASLTIIGIPLGIWLFDRVPGAVSLHR